MLSEETYPTQAGLETDVEIAARTRVPVLITAAPDRALTIARAIAARSDASGTKSLRVCDSAAGDDLLAVLNERRHPTARDRGTTTFLLREVHRLTAIEQGSVMRLLDARRLRPPSETARLITTSSVSLFDRVRQGTFDARLFQRLNTIHIVVP